MYKRQVSLTYALPGAVIALSLIILLAFLTKLIGVSIAFGSVVILVYAYVMRYMAVGISPLRSSFDKHPETFDDTGKNLGMTNFKLFKKIHLPINISAIYIAFILCFVDIIKELPITLILRPFNFETFATTAYISASEDLLEAAAVPSLCLIIIASFFILLTSKYILRDRDE